MITFGQSLHWSDKERKRDICMQEKREREGEDFVQIEQKNGREEKHSSQSTTSLFLPSEYIHAHLEENVMRNLKMSMYLLSMKNSFRKLID